MRQQDLLFYDRFWITLWTKLGGIKMSLIYAGFAVLAAWWIIFIAVELKRKQTPIWHRHSSEG